MNDANAIAAIETAVITIGPDTPPQVVGQVRNAVAFVGEEARRLKRLLDDRLREIMEETGRDIVLNESVRLYLGVPKEYVPRDLAAVMSAVLDAAGGDMAGVTSCLASGCWKAGAVRSLLDDPDRFASLFETVEKPEVRDGKPLRKVLVADDRFNGPPARKRGPDKHA